MLLSLGVFLLCIPLSSIMKIGAMLTIIGFFIVVLKTEDTVASYTKKLPIMPIMIIWVIVVYLITVLTNVSGDILFFLVLIGLIVIYEYTSKVISLIQKNRLHFTIIIFLMIIALILLKKIMSMSNM
jgi:hypothetical protein